MRIWPDRQCHSDAIRILTSGISALRSTGATGNGANLTLTCLARPMPKLGQFEDAWRCIDDAMTTIEKTKETWWEAEVSRIAGEIAL